MSGVRLPPRRPLPRGIPASPATGSGAAAPVSGPFPVVVKIHRFRRRSPRLPAAAAASGRRGGGVAVTPRSAPACCRRRLRVESSFPYPPTMKVRGDARHARDAPSYLGHPVRPGRPVLSTRPDAISRNVSTPPVPQLDRVVLQSRRKPLVPRRIRGCSSIREPIQRVAGRPHGMEHLPHSRFRCRDGEERFGTGERGPAPPSPHLVAQLFKAWGRTRPSTRSHRSRGENRAPSPADSPSLPQALPDRDRRASPGRSWKETPRRSPRKNETCSAGPDGGSPEERPEVLVVPLDLPGRGRSGRPPARGYGTETVPITRTTGRVGQPLHVDPEHPSFRGTARRSGGETVPPRTGFGIVPGRDVIPGRSVPSASGGAPEGPGWGPQAGGTVSLPFFSSSGRLPGSRPPSETVRPHLYQT